MTTSLNENRKIRLLFSQLLNEPILIPQSLSDLHPNFSLWLLLGIKLAIVQDKLLVLEEYRDSEARDWLPVVVEEFLQHRVSIHKVELFGFLAESASEQKAKF